MRIKKMPIFFAVIAFILFIQVELFATPALQSSFIATYPFLKKSQLESCTTCHMPNVDQFLNYYGLALKQNMHDFNKIASLDSDGDGMNNGDEIKAKRFPGSMATFPEYFVFMNTKGKVDFNHEMHVVEDSYLSSGNCGNCHGGPELFPKYFNDKESLRIYAHRICWSCHKTSGSENAPQRCDECHQKN